jgi:hypothetical protein
MGACLRQDIRISVMHWPGDVDESLKIITPFRKFTGVIPGQVKSEKWFLGCHNANGLKGPIIK